MSSLDASLPSLPPVPRKMQSAWRREGLRIKQERVRGHVGPRIWAGTPGTDHDVPRELDPWGPPPGPPLPVAAFSVGAREELDLHDRYLITLNLTAEVLGTVEEPYLWIARSGSPEPCPEDLAWLGAATAAWATLTLTPRYAIVTREGWCLLPSGHLRRWRRLRS